MREFKSAQLDPYADLSKMSRMQLWGLVWAPPIFSGLVVGMGFFIPLFFPRVSSEPSLSIILPWIPMSFFFAAFPISLLFKNTRQLQGELKEVRAELSEARNAQAQAP